MSYHRAVKEFTKTRFCSEMDGLMRILKKGI